MKTVIVIVTSIAISIAIAIAIAMMATYGQQLCVAVCFGSCLFEVAGNSWNPLLH